MRLSFGRAPPRVREQRPPPCCFSSHPRLASEQRAVPLRPAVCNRLCPDPSTTLIQMTPQRPLAP